MKRLIVKLLLALFIHILYFVTIAGIGITNAFVGKKAALLELSLFTIMVILLFISYFVAPLSSKAHKIIYWVVSTQLSLFTEWFWMYFISGPIWKY